jgi:ParB family chromosome partitioning protein
MSKKIPTGLGKGLGALIPTIKVSEDGIEITADDSEEKSGDITFIELSKIVRNQYQPRTEFDDEALQVLKNSIVEHGLIQPITVRRSVNGYELISGERRWRASQLAGLTKIPAYVLDDVSDNQMLILALVENVVRQDLNPIEEANAYQRLIEECRLTHDDVAQKVSKDRSTITNTLRLLKLPEIIQDSLRDKQISMGHARALLPLDNAEIMIAVWKKILENNLSVRSVESLIRDIQSGKISFEKKKAKSAISKQTKKQNVSYETSVILENFENRFRQKFGTKVVINPKNEDSGTVEIDFYSKDDLERIFELFDGVN